MATVKLKFRPSSVQSAEGTLYFQVTHKRKVKWLSTGFYVFPNEWDANTATVLVPAAGKRNAVLILVQSKVELALRQWKLVLNSMELNHNDFTVEELCDAFNRNPLPKTVFMFLQEQVVNKELMMRHGTARTYSNAYRRFKAFRNDVDLTFDQLTPGMIEHLEAWFIHRRLKQNSIRCYLRTLNTMFSKALEEGLLRNRNLFSRVHLSYVPTAKRAIGEKEMRMIAKLQLREGSTLALARDIFVFSYYMRGMSFVDIAYLRKTDLRNGMWTYSRMKTNQSLTVEWEEAQQRIIDRYASKTKDSRYLFPVIKQEDGTEYEQCQRMQLNINRALKKIGERIGLKIPLTTYVARHIWASVARNVNVPVSVISVGMGHRSIKTTEVYLDSVDISRVNEANRMLIKRIEG